jgi:hypothetical protein
MAGVRAGLVGRVGRAEGAVGRGLDANGFAPPMIWVYSLGPATGGPLGRSGPDETGFEKMPVAPPESGLGGGGA